MVVGVFTHGLLAARTAAGETRSRLPFEGVYD